MYTQHTQILDVSYASIFLLLPLFFLTFHIFYLFLVPALLLASLWVLEEPAELAGAAQAPDPTHRLAA